MGEKTMKKVVSVVLALIMTFSLFGVVASAESQELVIAVANDMHYNLKASKTVTKRNSIDEDFFHIGYCVLMLFLFGSRS